MKFTDIMFQVELREYEKVKKFTVTMKAVKREKLSILMEALESGNSRITIPQTTIQVCFQWKMCDHLTICTIVIGLGAERKGTL